MTLIELCEDVSSLTLDGELLPDFRFRSAVARAMTKLFCDCSFVKYHTLIVARPKLSEYVSSLDHQGGASETLPISGRAYSMYAYGKGNVTVTDRERTSNVQFDGEGTLIRGFICGDASITLGGECDFAIRELRVYERIYGDTPEAIPSSDSASIFMRELTADFLGFAGMPTRSDGTEMQDARYIGDELILPKGFEGKINIPYYRAPISPVNATENCELDIPVGCAHLVALLSAYYLIIEDAPELAEAYLGEYESAPKPTDKFRRRSAVWESNGWA